MCCGNGCTPHRPLINADPDRYISIPAELAAPAEIVEQLAVPVGVESRRNRRWRVGVNRQLTDVQETYDGRVTHLPRPDGGQLEQMTGVVPTPDTGIRRTAVRDTGQGGGCAP